MKGFLKVISVIMIILGVLIVGLTIFNISIIRTAGDGVIADVLTGAMIVVLGIGGVMDLLGGFLGLRAAKDPSKSAAALVFGTLAPGKSAEIKAFRTSFPEVRDVFSLKKM